MRFRKKPIIVHAEQWYPPDPDSPYGLERDALGVLYLGRDSNGDAYGNIRTREGRMEVHEGDWIITGVKGEKYPCKPDIFEMTYEPVDEGEETQP